MFRELWANGWHVIPVAPGGVQVQKKLKTGEIVQEPGGKLPGRCVDSSGLWVPLQKWTRYASEIPDGATLREWEAYPGANVGFVTGRLVGVDIDCLDAELAGELAEAVQARLGRTPFVRIGRAPKMMLLYRVAEGFRKKRTATWSGGQAVEVLSNGQQLVGLGKHTSGVAYKWTGVSPLQAALDDVPLVEDGEDAFDAVVADCERLVGEWGLTFDDTAKANGHAGHAPVAVEGMIDRVGRVGEALERIGNDGTAVHYDDWIRVGLALKAAYLRDDSAGCDLWHAWSAKSAKYDRARTQDKWEGFLPDGRVTAGTIYELAKRGGWKPQPEAGAPEDDFASGSVAVGDGAGGANGDKWDGTPFKLERGKPDPRDFGNIVRAMQRMGVRVSYDEFRDRTLIEGLPGFGPLLDDAAINRLAAETQRLYEFLPSFDLIWRAVENHALRFRVHPVREYLAGLTWDGVARLDDWLAVYCGAERNEYVSAVGRLTLIAAVRRVRAPGCVFQEMLVLEQEQGTGKSTALAALAGRADWFSDNFPLSAAPREVIEFTRGRWIMEASELMGIRRGEVAHLKAMLARTADNARMAYARREIDVPRQFIVIGTTNDSSYLRDSTGNRRFWPVRTGRIDLAGIVRDRDQLWAEAAALEAGGASIRLDVSLWAVAADVQDKRTASDGFVDRLEAVLGDVQGKIASVDVLSILGISGSAPQDSSVRAHQAMASLGFEKKKIKVEGRALNGYTRGSMELIQVAWVNNKPVIRKETDVLATESSGEVLGNGTAKSEAPAALF